MGATIGHHLRRIIPLTLTNEKFGRIHRHCGAHRYDKLGKAGVATDQLMDPGALFGMLFGSDVFVDYIGELQMASLASLSQEDGTHNQDVLKAKLQELQKVRLCRQAKVSTECKFEGSKYLCRVCIVLAQTLLGCPVPLVTC